MSNKMIPLFDKVIIERDTLQTKSSIIIPDDAARRNAPATGVIVAVGPDTEQVKEGQRVLFGLHAGSFIKDDDDNDFFVCLDVDILCVLEDTPTVSIPLADIKLDGDIPFIHLNEGASNA